MKIGILTYHWVANFGANLQTLSTYNFLKNNGQDPIIINWIPSDLEEYYKKNTTIKQLEEHITFTNNNFQLTPICRTKEDIQDVIKLHKIKLVIIGSDAVLTLDPFFNRIILSKRGILLRKVFQDSKYPNPFWGNFISKEMKCHVALMSASAQNTRFSLIINPISLLKIFINLKKFFHITVRDTWTQLMIKYLSFGKIVPQVTPDPVFALNNYIISNSPEDIKKKYNITHKYIIVSCSKNTVSEEWVLKLKKSVNKIGFQLIELPTPQRCNVFKSVDISIQNPLPVMDWYYLIKFSNGYIGELMHPVIVSLHNSIPFYSFDNYGFVKGKLHNLKSSKIYDILKDYNFLNYHFSIFNNRKLPDTDMIIEHLLTFNKEFCKEISIEKERQFRKNLLNIVEKASQYE